MKSKLAVVVAVVMGLIAVVGVYQYLQTKTQKAEEEHGTVMVIASSQRIRKGERITKEMLMKKEFREADVSEEHYLLSDLGMVLGQTINRAVEPETALMKSYFRTASEPLPSFLEKSERAMAIRVDPVTGVAGNIVPGSTVDVIGTFDGETRSPDGKRLGPAETRVVTMLTKVRVLAIDNRTRETDYISTGGSSRRATYSTVTLAVTPEEVNALVFAQQEGIITLVLRAVPDLDTGPAAPEVNERNLFDTIEGLRDQRVERTRDRKPLTVGN